MAAEPDGEPRLAASAAEDAPAHGGVGGAVAGAVGALALARRAQPGHLGIPAVDAMAGVAGGCAAARIGAGAVSFTEALGHLQRLSYRPFAAQNRRFPLQILGLLEAAGQPFDALWVMGMDGRNWPPPAQPNPLLPIALQRAQLMPRSSSQRELLWPSALPAVYARRHLR